MSCMCLQYNAKMGTSDKNIFASSSRLLFFLFFFFTFETKFYLLTQIKNKRLLSYFLKFVFRSWQWFRKINFQHSHITFISLLTHDRDSALLISSFLALHSTSPPSPHHPPHPPPPPPPPPPHPPPPPPHPSPQWQMRHWSIYDNNNIILQVHLTQLISANNDHNYDNNMNALGPRVLKKCDKLSPTSPVQPSVHQRIQTTGSWWGHSSLRYSDCQFLKSVTCDMAKSYFISLFLSVSLSLKRLKW